MKTWFITGASRGFGARIAEKALERGDAVVATARRPEAITDRLGKHDRLLAVSLNVESSAQAQEATRLSVQRFGRIDVLVNNAGYGLVGAVEEASDKETEALFRTNVFGLLSVTRAVLPVMRAQRSGLILNFSSIGGYRAGPGFGIYSATKFAVEALSESLRAELSLLGISVTAIEPGYFRTDFLDGSSLLMSETVIADYAETAGLVRTSVSRINHNQPGDPDRLASVIVNLADEPNPPVRLPLGSDTIFAIEAKHRSDKAIIETWRPLAISTDFPDS